MLFMPLPPQGGRGSILDYYQKARLGFLIFQSLRS